MKNNKINYNDLIRLKNYIEEIFEYFIDTHKDFVEIFNDSECLDDNKINNFYSYLKEYESSLDELKSNFHKLRSNNNNINSCISPTKLLKKKRLSRLQSNMRIEKNNYLDDDLPF